ncbi:site-specific DNA-methyltransferase [Mesorhizobium sp. RP14(2022)]|uniref:Methyltransferase n=1 Tax=Mesorhizobium liriopis TaxID=2953882 RepID=A0ABT1CCS9_9HYPH|nr:DNA methyltransferase [Mesorhizobium liriopis]MCO6052328.1 site-specific DNA-methyltransferase [Mesorhizobium liriopis]
MTEPLSLSDQPVLGVQAWPADRVERRAVASLIPYARNARTHSAQQVAQIAASITQWGWTVPVLIDEGGAIIAGHGRVLAARSLGITEVPVMVASGWSAEQKRAYLLADNQLALNAGWDEELLRLELGELATSDFDLSLVGFSDAELARLQLFGAPGLTDPDDVPDAPAKPVNRLGDLWLLGKHRLLCGDSTDASNVARVLAGVVPHLMVTDPPYGVEYDPAWRTRMGTTSGAALGTVLNDHRADWREAWALFPGDVAYVWHGGLHAGTVAQSLLASGFCLRSQIIWDKGQLVLSRGDYHWQHEPCWYAVRDKAKGHWAGDRKQTTVWQVPKPRKNETGHSTQKPVECMLRPIENNSSPGQGVYEPFSGSGTTVIAAEMSGRTCHAIELSPAYVDVAIQRWQAFTGQEARLERAGEEETLSFAAVAAARGVTLADAPQQSTAA